MHGLSVDSGLMMQTCQAEIAKYRLGNGDTGKITEGVARDATSKLPWAIDRLVAQRVWRVALIARRADWNQPADGRRDVSVAPDVAGFTRCTSGRIGR
jgi:hypothetical protein